MSGRRCTWLLVNNLGVVKGLVVVAGLSVVDDLGVVEGHGVIEDLGKGGKSRAFPSLMSQISRHQHQQKRGSRCHTLGDKEKDRAKHI